MAEPRGQHAAEAQYRTPPFTAGGLLAARASAHDASPPAWEHAGRPATPTVDAAGGHWRSAGAPAPPSRHQQQRAGTPAASHGHATPPPARPASGLLRSIRTSSNSLTGLLKGSRPSTAVAAGGSPAGGSPLFEVRGAAMALPDPPAQPQARPATASPSPAGIAAAGHGSADRQRPSTAAHAQQQQQHKHAAFAASASPPAFNIQARAGLRAAAAAAAGGSGSAAHATSSAAAGGAQRQQPTAVAAHGLDLGTSPPLPCSPAMSLAQQLKAGGGAAAASSSHSSSGGGAGASMQQQQAEQGRRPSSSSGAGSSRSSSFGAAAGRSSSGGGSRFGAAAAAAGAAGAAGGSTTMHCNPLYSSGSEAYARPRHQQAAAAGRQPPPVRVHAGAGSAAAPAAAEGGTASRPSTPLAAPATSLPAAPTPGTSPLAGMLQAASNLTILNDSRPISPGPFLSTLASGALPESGSRSHSRPVSPQCMESTPPTPGSFAPLSGAAAAAARAGSNLSPVRTGGASAAAAAAAQSRSLPTSPAPQAAASAAASPAAPAGCVANGFRLPIFDQDGRLVGYKQNSNLIQRPGACISSAPSSPNRSGGLSGADAFTTQNTSTMDGSSPLPSAKAAAPAPSPADSSDFAEALADPCRGFPDPDNMVPGYVLGPVLGKGGFCSVRKALHQLTGQAVAVKIIEKGKLKDPKDRDRVDRECRVMRNLSNHCCVIKLFEAVETRDYVYIMMEAARRGSLLDYVRERKKLPEGEAVTIFQQLLHSLQFCHRKDVVHRDIKLENILIDSAGHMKLIDFGLCGYYVAGKRLRCHCGSPSYAAPEIVARKDYLGPPVDVWSLGIVLFAMLAGYLPFHAKEKKQLSEKILAGVYKPAAWMSAAAQDLLSRMLTLDPDQRISLEGVWQHPWVASAPRWEPPGVGAGRLYRALTDPTTGAVLADDAVLAQLELLGADTAAIRRALRSRECNSLTATYHLMLEARLEAQRSTAAARDRGAVVGTAAGAGGAAAERAAPPAAAPAAAAAAPAAASKPASTAGDWQWDFALIGAAAAGRSAGAAAQPASGGSSSSGAVGSAGSSSLRGNSSPLRPRTAHAGVVPAGSPTRFGQEAAAAGYLCSPRRAGAAAAAAAGWEHHHFSATSGALFGSSQLHQVTAAAAGQAAGSACATPTHSAQPAPAAPEWDIKAVHPAESATAAAGAMATPSHARAGPPAAVAHPVVPPLILATAALTPTEGALSPGTAKSPCLSPLPAALSPKLLPGAGGSGAAASAASEQHSPPVATAV